MLTDANTKPALQDEGKNAILLCPGCGANYLHHHQIKAYAREEDRDTTVIVVDGHNVSREVVGLSKNPSDRRDAIGIIFDCELCCYIGELTIAQHKGLTYLEWRQLAERMLIPGG